MIDLNEDRIEGLDFAIPAVLPILGKVASVGSSVVSFGKKLFHHKHKKHRPSPPPRPAPPKVIVQKKDNTMLYLALAGAGLFLLTRRKR